MAGKALRLSYFVCIFALSICFAGYIGPWRGSPALGAPGGRHGFDRVFIIVFENASYNEVIRDPIFAAFAKQGALMTNYYGTSHPSEPNYFAMTAGTDFGLSDDKLRTIDAKHIGDLLDAKGLSWKNYVERDSLKSPVNCQNAYSPFDANHVPFVSYRNMSNDLTRCNRHVVDASQLAVDIQNNALPTYSFYTPNLQNDGHDSSVTFAGKWFANNIEPLFSNPNFMSGTLVIVTFDEGESSDQIYTALYGSMIVPGSSSNIRYDHYNMLKTVEDNFGLGDLGQKDASAEAFAGIWNSGDLRSQSNPAKPR
jgi:hypothetical protein